MKKLCVRWRQWGRPHKNRSSWEEVNVWARLSSGVWGCKSDWFCACSLTIFLLMVILKVSEWQLKGDWSCSYLLESLSQKSGLMKWQNTCSTASVACSDTERQWFPKSLAGQSSSQIVSVTSTFMVSPVSASIFYFSDSLNHLVISQIQYFVTNLLNFNVF